MPYLSFDLDAKKRALRCATAVGVPVGSIVWGLLELWEHAWAAKSAIVTEMALDGCFGPGERTRAALVEFGFLEALEGGAYRVKGAERYLRISEAQSAAGKKRASGARNERGELVKREAANQLLTSSSPAPHQLSASRQPALTPSTEHLTKKEETKAPREERASQAPGFVEMRDALVATYEAERGEKYLFDREKDPPAIKALLPFGVEKASARYRLGLRAVGFHATGGIAQLRAKWKDLATLEATGPPKPAPSRESKPCTLL